MNINYLEIEQFVFEYVSYIKSFNVCLTSKYHLNDIPYNVAGKSFPKKGAILVNNEDVEYRFHGRGCTLFWGKLHIFFNVDATSIHQIIITPGGLQCFLESRIQGYNEKGYSDEIENILNGFEERGVFMKRKLSDLGTYHVNEVWYSAYKNKTDFSGGNKNEIDWI